jgi:hypothetical protein
MTNRIRALFGRVRQRQKLGQVLRHPGKVNASDEQATPCFASLLGSAPDALPSSYNVETLGRMFWFIRKKFVGSYLPFSATSRSYWVPYAARTRSWPSSPR